MKLFRTTRYRPRNYYVALLPRTVIARHSGRRGVNRPALFAHFPAIAHEIGTRPPGIEYFYGHSPVSSYERRKNYKTRKTGIFSFIERNLAMPVFFLLILMVAYASVVLSSRPA